MGWLLLAALGIIWAAFLLPAWRRSPNKSVEDFGRNMDLLADTEGNARGRWIVTPRKGIAFVGSRERARERARERRRRVFVFVLESIGLTFLIGLVPPLRAMWFATGVLLMLLGAYVWLLLSAKVRRGAHRALGTRATPEPARPDLGRPRAAAVTPVEPVELDEDLANIVVRRAGRRVGVGV